MTAESPSLMETLLKDSPPLTIPQPGELIEGRVALFGKNLILVDIGGVLAGIISGRETKDSDETIKELKVGDLITACVLESENEEGFVILSLRRAGQEKTWDRFLRAYEKGEILEVRLNEANKGGLLLEVDGIKGFIPVSQLAPLHYPRVDGADANLILQRLQQLVGLSLKAKIISLDKENGKLILSEKAAFEESRKTALAKIKVGQKVKGVISGVVKFGIFVAFEGLEGLVHISEIAWSHVKNPADFGKVGQEVEVLIIGIEREKISLSMKRLQPDPWVDIAKKYKVGDTVLGEITRIAQFGAFMKLDEEINGLIHLSELSPELVKDPTEVVKVGGKVKAKIIEVNLDEHRIGLSVKALAKPQKTVEEKKKAVPKAKKTEKEEKDPPKKKKKEAGKSKKETKEKKKKTE